MTTKWAEMTDRERDAAIGERFGGWGEGTHEEYVSQRDEFGEGQTAFDRGSLLPHYTTDANAVRLVEDEIERRGLQNKYLVILYNLIVVHRYQDFTSHWDTLALHAVWWAVRATPAQRCEAAWRVFEGE